jgi:MFS family permease
MEIFGFIKTRNLTALFGYGLFISFLATGYYYNVTFVQLGLVDLGVRLIGMDRPQVANNMAILALITCAVALVVGWGMMKRGWSSRFIIKLRLSFAVIVLQTILTAAAPHIRSESAYLTWIVLASVALGVGVPVTFGMTVDLIPRSDRGYVAAIITAVAYFAAPVLSAPWEIEHFSRQMLFVMVPGVPVLGFLAFKKTSLIDRLAQQHKQPEFWYGRYVRRGQTGKDQVSWKLVGLIILMFGVFFVDSLGFLRMTETPFLMEEAWTSPEPGPRVFLGWVHVGAAFIGGVLYTNFPGRALFYWVFGLFGLVHLSYTFPFRFGGDTAPPIGLPALYSTAVSLYTVINFAIWADVSTPRTITRNAALGVALSGWSATFISTALAISWEAAGVPLDQHLRIVDALAILFFLAMLVVAWLPTRRKKINASGERIDEEDS